VLLLVTLALVVASAVLLILGFVQDALGFIYLSMLCAGVAALALFVFARLTKRRSAALAGAGVVAGVGSPYMAADEVPAAEEIEPTSSLAVAPPVPAPEPLRPEPAAVTAVGAPEEEDPWAPEDSSDDWGDEILFPIEDYDDLRVAEILPLLGQLEPDELQEVRDRELAGKARATILDRIDDRLNRRPAALDTPASITDTASLPAIEAEPEAEREAEPAVEMAPAPAPRKRAAAKAAKAIEPAPGPAQKAPAARKATRTTKAAEPTPAPARKAAAAKAAPAKANPAKAAAKTTNSAAPATSSAAPATSSAAPAAKRAAAPAKKTVAKTTKAATRATPAKRAAKKSQ
jgi:hypothetical protein